MAYYGPAGMLETLPDHLYQLPHGQLMFKHGLTGGFLCVLFRHNSGPSRCFLYSDSAPMSPGMAAQPSPIISFRVLI